MFALLIALVLLGALVASPPAQASEGTTVRPACNDGRDNDGDGRRDFRRDRGCSSRFDRSERPDCRDRRDNDRDGLADYPGDPGCTRRSDRNETNRAVQPGPAAADTRFTLVPPNSGIPRDDAYCAARVRRHPWEPRPQNAEENAVVPTSRPWTSDPDPRSAALKQRVTGNFTGTTDEIIQWVSCKWGFDEYVQRAQAVVESWWDMETAGDGGRSLGLYQVNPQFHGGCPISNGKAVLSHRECWTHHSTALSADLAMAILRSCYEGYWVWLNALQPRTGTYAAGDYWGCIGAYYSGRWNDTSGGGGGGGAQGYMRRVRNALDNRSWAQPGFGPGAEQFPW